jgi:hypothetical protein
MAQRIQLRRGTAAEWAAANPVLAVGEPGVETDTGKQKFGDGVTAWNSRPYASKGDTGPVGPPNTDASLLATGTVPEGRLPSRLADTALNATYAPALVNGKQPVRVGDLFHNIKDYGAVGNGAADDTAAFNAAIAAAGVDGGAVFFPAGVYLINGTTDPVPGGVWLVGTGYDYHTPASVTDKPRKMSVIRAGAVMTRLIQLGTDGGLSTSGATGASIKHLVVDGDRKAATVVKTAGRRNRIMESEIYFGTTNALWIGGQNTHVVGNVIAQDNTGDVIFVNGFYDNKIWDNQIRQPGTTGAAIHVKAASQTDIQRNHMWAGANAVAAAAKALIWLEADSTSGVQNTLIQDNTVEGVLGPEILLDGVNHVAGVRGAEISGNRFYQNDCEDWGGWSGTGWQSWYWPFHTLVVTHKTIGPCWVSCN